MDLIYLASPYAHPSGDIRRYRALAAAQAAARLMFDRRCGVFSPIAHGHAIAGHCPPGFPPDEVWLELDLAILRISTSMAILRLVGWDKSSGIAREAAEAERIGIPVEFIDP